MVDGSRKAGVVRTSAAVLGAFAVAAFAISLTRAQQQAPVKFGGAYSSLDQRRQALVVNWLARFAAVTGQTVEPGIFYDEIIALSAKTTFEAVTHALMTSTLEDRSGASLGDALALIERVESVRGEIDDAPSDRQFRMYVRLTPGALEALARSRQFKRGADNAFYHEGYPTNYRAVGGVPSVQFSVALDGRRADVDVDYRASSFPIALMNGHLTASNSDVRAGNNFDRHVGKWAGFQNWWNGFFGGARENQPAVPATPERMVLPRTPRVGKKNVDVMINDFLNAWLVEGNIMAAMGYVSEQSYACLAKDSDNPGEFDRGMAPFQIMGQLKSAYDELGPHKTLDGLLMGTRLTMPGLRVVEQPNHARYVMYSVPDDVAARLDCQSQITLGDPAQVKRVYGNYTGVTFYVEGRRGYPMALLWAREDGYWKIASWKVGADDAAALEPDPIAASPVTRINADPTLAQAGRAFLDAWLVRRDYDAAFAFLSPKSYACYNLERGPGSQPATSDDDAGRKLRAALEAVGKARSGSRRLEDMLSVAEVVHPTIRMLNHPMSRVFSLTSPPNGLSDAVECAARASGNPIPDPMPLEYGEGFGMTVRFKTRDGDAPVLRLLWRKDNGAWRITSYGVELP